MDCNFFSTIMQVFFCMDYIRLNPRVFSTVGVVQWNCGLARKSHYPPISSYILTLLAGVLLSCSPLGSAYNINIAVSLHPFQFIHFSARGHW